VPLFYQNNINAITRLAIWKIEEPESFFKDVPLSREITHPHKRLQHLAGRYLLHYLFPDFPSDEILIASTRKPYLPDEQYHFSVSHCGDYAAAIVSSHQRLGIDIEIPAMKVLKIVHKFLHPEELEIFNIPVPSFSRLTTQTSLFPAHDYRLPTLLWSAKEAMFKWWGRGDVDFSEVLRIHYFDLKEEGNMPASFIKRQTTDLGIKYKLFPHLCLAWVCTDAGDTEIDG
jgi:phosphopantetheinyl transferase